jgi:(E)-4-hydroxy-3-methylbut-2-enyl-diphosphate synthase
MTLYCHSLSQYSRFKTREVKVGSVGIGGKNPIRIQSMTTTNTMDTETSVAQSIRMIHAGAELVRLTAPGIKDAENLKNIKSALRKKGYDIPLVADIHFTPNAALIAAEIVEKVRINPGNYVDKKQFKSIDYTDQSYEEELERIHERFLPLIRVCKENGTALRIGTNHGSLSDRILSRYGDTPLGMVESALEFTRICIDENFHEIVFSMKASNTHVMIQAYRLLVKTMKNEGMNYPLHLGVTEAGEGEDGRIKSALGIGALLEDGIGDTIRVSLTEEPENELPVAQSIVDRIEKRKYHFIPEKKISFAYDPYFYKRNEAKSILNIGGNNVPVVVSDLSNIKVISLENLEKIGLQYSSENDKWTLGDLCPDYIYLGKNLLNFVLPENIGLIQNFAVWNGEERHFPLFTTISEFESNKKSAKLNFVLLENQEDLKLLKNVKEPFVLILMGKSDSILLELRTLCMQLVEHNINSPVLLSRKTSSLNLESLQLHLATDFGGLLADGFGDGLMTLGDSRFEKINLVLFGILQAARVRISKTEYISCPSCGRTLFDLQKVTANIRERTSHLKGVKIGIMGCIVNGPGEMADADYGYVGTGKEKISLYKGQEKVQANISADYAVDALIQLIKDHGDWFEPTS